MNDDVANEKNKLRQKMRVLRRAHEASYPDMVRALLFSCPPGQIAAMVPGNNAAGSTGVTIGIYHAYGSEAPTRAYTQWFAEHGHQVALPWFAQRGSAMEYRIWQNPWDEGTLVKGPYGILQPRDQADNVIPDLVFVPLLAFTPSLYRLGQGGGHYDRWHAQHRDVPAIGLAWDCQLVPSLPIEAHDHQLTAVITPTRIYERAAGHA